MVKGGSWCTQENVPCHERPQGRRKTQPIIGIGRNEGKKDGVQKIGEVSQIHWKSVIALPGDILKFKKRQVQIPASTFYPTFTIASIAFCWSSSA